MSEGLMSEGQKALRSCSHAVLRSFCSEIIPRSGYSIVAKGAQIKLFLPRSGYSIVAQKRKKPKYPVELAPIAGRHIGGFKYCREAPLISYKYYFHIHHTKCMIQDVLCRVVPEAGKIIARSA